MKSVVSIGQAGAALGVSVCTLRRWERAGYFAPSFRTQGGHRRYDLANIEALIRGEEKGGTPSCSKVVV